MSLTSPIVSDILSAKKWIQSSLSQAQSHHDPYRHWTLEQVFPSEICTSLTTWNPGKEAIAGDTAGRRETHNAHRVFVTPEMRKRDAGLAALADSLECEETRAQIAAMTGSPIEHLWLRMELCLDTDGFWLEHHTDIGAKKLTFLVSLSTGEGAEEWGTDIMNEKGEALKRSSGRFNSGFIFVPGTDTWHGFVRRPIKGLRRTLIINYVDTAWRARHELAFSDQIG